MTAPSLPSRAKKKTVIHFLSLILGIMGCTFAHAQLSSPAEAIKDRYLKRVAAADKIKAEATERLSRGYENEIKMAQEEMKRGFDSAIQTATFRNRTEEVRQLTQERETLLNSQSSNALQASTTGQGSDYKDLVGTWITPPGSNYTYTFEFKSNKEVTYTYNYQSNSESNQYSYQYRASQKGDRIVIDKTREASNSSETISYYEINIPFNTDSLEVNHHYSSASSKYVRTYKLIRKK